MFKTVFALTLTLVAFSAHAADKKVGPCEQIEQDCKKNGYVAGEAKQGKGLWWDCMCPLIGQGFPEPSKNVLQVPSDQGLVAACQQHPRGAKIVAKCADMMAKKSAKPAAK